MYYLWLRTLYTLQHGLNWGDKALGRILRPFVFPAAAVSSTTMLQTHHHLQYNKIYLVWNLDCDL